MKRTIAKIHRGLAWIIFAGCIMQIYLIALYVFGAGTRENHAFGGFLLMIAALLMLVAALIIRANKWNVILSAAVFLLLFPVQSILAYSEIGGAFRALHGVNGMLIMGLSYALANGFARAVVTEPTTSAEKAVQSTAAAD